MGVFQFLASTSRAAAFNTSNQTILSTPLRFSQSIGALHSILQTRIQQPCNPRPMSSSSTPPSDASSVAFSASSSPPDADTRAPATVISGFLGSGKFGEVDIDTSLVANHSSVSEDIVMVNNGCLCCTVRGDLVKMLLKLAKKKRDKFDHIVIETTGLANPGPVIETFYTDDLVSDYVKLDGVVTLVDCKHAMQHLNEVKPRFLVNEAVEQVAYADRIILNKIDLVTELELEALTKKIRHINGMAQITKAKFGAVDMDFVLGVGGYDLARIESEVQVDGSQVANQLHDPGHEHHHRHPHGHAHDSAVSSVSIVSEGVLDLDEVDDWLERLVDEKGDDLYRMKGILSINGSNERYIFQGVKSMLDGSSGKPWGSDEKRLNKLVFIGRNLDEDVLKKGFKGCLV
ncbi:hypothetical protein Scep_007256 [Stephania cephalantha]|uniref:CobW C-terminal domain-containing protein n=1 Tax=Stephania cephalantha TaxID=152367 RepID=A0AAP0KB78_9MAGN